MKYHISLEQIIFRLLLVILIAGFIGWDRQKKNRPAGVQVHILVGIGAVIVAMIQQELGLQALKLAANQPGIADHVATDAARLIAAVISGIGFLGAGTIIVTNRVVRGLSTAASLWACAALGIAVGMGYYAIALAGGITVALALLFLERVLRIDMGTDIQVEMISQKDEDELLEAFFKKRHIRFIPKDFRVENNNGERHYTVSYAIKRPVNMSYDDLATELIKLDEIIKVDLVSY